MPSPGNYYKALQEVPELRQMLQQTLSIFNLQILHLKHVGFHGVRWATTPCQPRLPDL